MPEYKIEDVETGEAPVLRNGDMLVFGPLLSTDGEPPIPDAVNAHGEPVIKATVIRGE